MTTLTPDARTIREVLRDVALAHQPLPAERLRLVAGEILEDGYASGAMPAGSECRALAALARGASLDSHCPPDPVDPVTALCAALDAGDDSALGVLADALEEAGDPRAAGLRRCHGREPAAWPRSSPGPSPVFGWRAKRIPGDTASSALPEAVWDRLSGAEVSTRGAPSYLIAWAMYDTRSAAFLALGEALIVELQRGTMSSPQ